MTKITKTHECSRPDCTTEIPTHHDICEYCADDTNDAELAADERAALTGALISSVYSRHDRTARTTEEVPGLKSWAANERERYNRARTAERQLPRIQDVDAAHEEALNTDPSDGFVYRHQNPWTPAPECMPECILCGGDNDIANRSHYCADCWDDANLTPPAPDMTDEDAENELWREYEDDRRAQSDLYSQIL